MSVTIEERRARVNKVISNAKKDPRKAANKAAKEVVNYTEPQEPEIDPYEKAGELVDISSKMIKFGITVLALVGIATIGILVWDKFKK